ncbi:MAG: hypothetical protein JSU65_08775 [Candidatus Zixiibacteriota bacterium]|nr:MAG: hypothetical protein JSU65_08775 [candidate division Zixibacteria bacterium]
MSHAMVFLNPQCNYGTGRARWEALNESLEKRFGRFQMVEIRSPVALVDRVSKAVADGGSFLVAAGGDGTVNLLMNAIMEAQVADKVTIGAVGLGSSNDFHKPFRPKLMLGGTPLRLDVTRAERCDLIRVEHESPVGELSVRHCLINASIGITAEGNFIFNRRLSFIQAIQRLSVNAAVMIAALKAIFSYRDIPCRLAIDGGEEKAMLMSNLGVIKRPHFAGGLCYDTAIEPADGKLGINIYRDLTLSERIKALVAFQRGRFRGRYKALSWTGSHLTVKSNRVFVLELDGEVVKARAVRFLVVPSAVRCCR